MKTAVRLLPALLLAAMACTATAATDPMLGQWAPTAAYQAGHPGDLNAMSVDPAAGGYIIRMGLKGQPPVMAMTIIPDGKPHPYASFAMGIPAPPGHPIGTCTRTQPLVIKCLVTGMEQPSVNVTFTVTADGKTLTMTDPDPEVYVRP